MPLVDTKCPHCGAALKINDAAKGTLLCPYCGSEYLVEQAINNVTNVTNVSTVNNYAGATIINNDSKKEFEITQGILEAYNGNDTEITIPLTVREISCSFSKYIKKITIPATVEEIDPDFAREIADVLDTSQNKIFRAENGILYKNDEIYAMGSSIKKYELKPGEHVDANFLKFIETRTFVKDIYLPSGYDAVIFYRDLNRKSSVKVHVLDINHAYLFGFDNSDFKDYESAEDYIQNGFTIEEYMLENLGNQIIFEETAKDTVEGEKRSIEKNKKLSSLDEERVRETRRLVAAGKEYNAVKSKRGKHIAGIVMYLIAMALFIVIGVSISSSYTVSSAKSTFFSSFGVMIGIALIMVIALFKASYGRPPRELKVIGGILIAIGAIDLFIVILSIFGAIEPDDASAVKINAVLLGFYGLPFFIAAMMQVVKLSKTNTLLQEKTNVVKDINSSIKLIEDKMDRIEKEYK